MNSYRIEFQLQRMDGDDFEEIGFGSTGEWGSLGQAAHILTSMVQNGEWETEPGQPPPSEIMADQVWVE